MCPQRELNPHLSLRTGLLYPLSYEDSIFIITPFFCYNKRVAKHIHNIRKDSEYRRILILRTVGNFLLFSSIFFIAKTFYQPFKQEIRYLVEKTAQKQYVIADSKEEETYRLLANERPKNLLAQTLQVKQVEVLVPQDPNFSIVVPKIAANSRIIPNVDASDENAYLDALNHGVAHAAGTAFPGEGGHIYLFAHSTDYFWNVGSYNAIFYLLNKLEKNDDITLFYNGQRYVYTVIGKEIVDPSQVQYMTRKTNREFLTLQTCWPPGTTLQRLLIFAVRKEE